MTTWAEIKWNDVYIKDYIVLRKSTHEIATECGCSQNTVMYNFKKLGAKLRAANETKKGVKQSNEHIAKRMDAIGKLTHKARREWGRKISKARKGMRFSKEHRLNMSKANKGVKGSNWKGGVGPEHERIRKSIEYRFWKEAVFARDDWTCQGCKIRYGTLIAHHIKCFSEYAELRFSVDNGISLCVACHRLTENYGRRKRTG